MAKWRDRVCSECGKIDHTASKSNVCLLCSKTLLREENFIPQEKLVILEHGYIIIEGPMILPRFFNKRAYKMRTPCCGSEWISRFDNFQKLVNHSIRNNTPPPCGVCGPKYRMNTALEGYLALYARDYNLSDFNDYKKVVRGISDKMYRKFKDQINPDNLTRGKKTYHLDHIIPIIECFKQGWPVEKASHPDNLQILTWTENLFKSGKII